MTDAPYLSGTLNPVTDPPAGSPTNRLFRLPSVELRELIFSDWSEPATLIVRTTSYDPQTGRTETVELSKSVSVLRRAVRSKPTRGTGGRDRPARAVIQVDPADLPAEVPTSDLRVRMDGKTFEVVDHLRRSDGRTVLTLVSTP